MAGLRRLILVLVLATISHSPPAQAQDWPNRPVTLINPFAAGGGTDAVLRSIAAHLADKFGQPFVMENKVGGGGAIGAVYVAKAAPDGYTFLYMATGPAVLSKLLYKSVPYDADKDFDPVILVSEAPQVIVSSPSLGLKTLRDLIDYGKANPGKLNIGHAGAGTTGHLAAALFLARTGITASLVGYRGAGPAIQDVRGGHIQAAFPIYIPAVASVTALAVTSAQRASFIPDVPTARESGVDVVATTWVALVGPAGVPKEIVAKLNAAINEFINSDEGRKRFATLGHLPLGGPPERVTQTMAADKARWAPVIAAEKITLDPN